MSDYLANFSTLDSLVLPMQTHSKGFEQTYHTLVPTKD